MLQYSELGVARCKCKLVLKILDLHIEWTCNRKNNHKMNCWFWKECLIIVNLSLGSGLRTSFGIYRIWPKNTRKIRHEYPTLASWINHDQELFPWSFLTSIRYMGDFGLHVEAGLVRSYCVYRNGFEGTFWIGNECESLLNEDSIHLNRNIFPIFWDFFVNSPICLPHRNFHHALTQEISCDACTLGTPRDVLSWSNSKRQRLLIHGKIVMWRW